MSSPNKMRRNTRPLPAWEVDRLRRGIDEELKGYANVEVIDPFSIDASKAALLPPRGPDDEPDLLTPGIVRDIATTIINSQCALETAAQAAGLPADLARDYAQQGNEDLRHCKSTRMAFFAVIVNKAEAAAKLALIKGVKDNPLGWLGLSWLLERQWPWHFTQNKAQWEQGRKASIAEAVVKQLELHRTDNALALPIYEESDIIDAE